MISAKKITILIYDKRKIYCLYFLISILASYITLTPLSGQISESIQIILYIGLIFSLVKLESNIKKVSLLFFKRWHKILLFLLEIYSVFSVVGMYILDSTVVYEIRYADIIYLILSYIWIRPIVLAVLAVLLCNMNQWIDNTNQKVSLASKLKLISISLLPCIIFLIGFNPAITSTDSEYCFNLAHKIWSPGFSMTNWQPPFYIFVLNLLIKVCDSITFISILQVIFFSVVFVDGLLYLYQKGVSKKVVIAIYCFITFAVSNIIQLITLWKDIPYMISLMWLTILLIKYVLDKEVYETNSGWHIQITMALVFTALFRQNGILPAFAIIILLPIIFKKTKRLIIVSSISILLLLLVKIPLYNAMNVSPAPQLKFFSLANDIMYSYYRGKPISNGAMEIVNKVTNNDPDNFNYNAYYVAYNGNEPQGYSTIEFIKIYIKNMLDNPRDSIMAILIRNTDIWSIVKPKDEIPGCVNQIGETNTYMENVYPFRKTNILTIELEKICNWITNNSVLFVLYWRSGIYNLLIIILALILLLHINRHKIQYALPFIPITMNIFTLCVSSGWSDFRYFWPSMTISLMLLCYFILVKDILISKKGQIIIPESRSNLILAIIGLVSLICCITTVLSNYYTNRNEILRAQTSIDSYLELLNHNRYESIIEIEDSSILSIPKYKNLFKGLDINISGKLEDKYLFTISEKGADIFIDYNGKTQKSLIGEIKFSANRTRNDEGIVFNTYKIDLDQKEYYTAKLQEDNGHNDMNVRILVLDKKTKKIIDFAVFRYDIINGILVTTKANHFL